MICDHDPKVIDQGILQCFEICENENPYYSTPKSMGIDPAYGSSAFGIVVTEWVDGIVQILHAEEYHRPDYNEMLSTVYGLISKYQIDKIYIDGTNPSFIKSLKIWIGEDADYDKVIARYKAEGFGAEAALKDMMIVPVNFNKEHKAMLGHCKMILEQDPGNGKIAINSIFDTKSKEHTNSNEGDQEELNEPDCDEDKDQLEEEQEEEAEEITNQIF